MCEGDNDNDGDDDDDYGDGDDVGGTSCDDDGYGGDGW